MRAPPIVYPLGAGPLMPAILVGFVNPTFSSKRWGQVRDELPPWLVDVDQQAGGVAMSYPGGLGVLLRLEANADRASSDPAHLIRGIRCMAEDPEWRVLRAEYPELETLCATRGEPYTQKELARLDRVLRGCFRLPAAVGGLEAFVEFEQVDLLSYFDGWRRVEIRPGITELEGEDRHYGERWRDGGPFDADLLAALRRIGQELELHRPVRAVLLWENAD